MLNFLRSILAPQTKINFDPDSSAIEVPVILSNGSRQLETKFVLDTGAAYTVITPAIMNHLELKSSGEEIEVMTASGIETAVMVEIPSLKLGRATQTQAPCLVTHLPSEAGISGLLGLSFLHHYKLRLNFSSGELILKKL